MNDLAPPPKRLLKEVNKCYYEEYDSEGIRKVRIETTVLTHFAKSNTYHNPTKTTKSEYL